MTTDPICGVWQLDQWVEFRDGDPYDLGATGRLFYHPEGHVSAIFTRPPVSAGGEPGVLAYAGRWQRDGEDIHHVVEHATIPRWVGTTLVRRIVDFTPGVDGRLLLRTLPETGRSGVEFLHDLIWVRAV